MYPYVTVGVRIEVPHNINPTHTQQYRVWTSGPPSMRPCNSADYTHARKYLRVRPQGHRHDVPVTVFMIYVMYFSMYCSHPLLLTIYCICHTPPLCNRPPYLILLIQSIGLPTMWWRPRILCRRATIWGTIKPAVRRPLQCFVLRYVNITYVKLLLYNFYLTPLRVSPFERRRSSPLSNQC
jgi:hypothetical protein